MKCPLYARMIYLKTEGFQLHSIFKHQGQRAVLQYGLPNDLLKDVHDPFNGARSEIIDYVSTADYRMGISIFAKINSVKKEK